MESLDTPSEGLSRRNFLIRLIGSGVPAVASSVQSRAQQALTSSNSPISNMDHRKLLDLVDEGESLLRKRMPKGTDDRDVRYFAIVPDRYDTTKKEIEIYRGQLIPVLNTQGKKIGKKRVNEKKCRLLAYIFLLIRANRLG